MITVWRLVKTKYVASAFSGDTAMRYGSRWNRPGVAMVYTASSLSLAVVEHFVNIDSPDYKIKLSSITAAIPDVVQIEDLNISSLPPDWAAKPPADSSKDIGSQWILGAKSAVLKVPSVAVQGEWNYLLNPAHPDFRKIKIHTPVSFSFDERMWKK
jgi:RES domain-containing protein